MSLHKSTTQHWMIKTIVLTMVFSMATFGAGSSIARAENNNVPIQATNDLARSETARAFLNMFKKISSGIQNLFPEKIYYVTYLTSQEVPQQTDEKTNNLPTTIQNITNTQPVIEREVKTVEQVKVIERVINTIERVETIVYNNGPAKDNDNLENNNPSKFIKKNFLEAGFDSAEFVGDTKFDGTVSFEPGTVIDFSGTHMFNLPFTTGG